MRSNQFVWKYLVLLLILVVHQSLSYAEDTQTQGKVTGSKMSEHPEWFKESFLEIADDVQEASEQDKHVMLYFETDGCPYCYKTIEEHFKQSPSREYIQHNFDVIALNVSGDREVDLNAEVSAAEKTIARQLKIVYSPTMVFLDKDNQPVLKLAGYRNGKDFKSALEYVQQKAYLKQSLTDYSNSKHRPAVYRFRSHPQIKNIRDLSSISDKPLAILFESADCLDCDTLHDGHLANSDIRKILSNFTLVRFDAHSHTAITDPQGKKTTTKLFADSLGISYRPSIVLFDRGREIIRIENLLYPYHFASVLEYVGFRHYELYPDRVWDYVDVKTARLVAAGHNVSLSEK
ncbi:MAG: thioredoxin fold domain-containing protein [Gammaproteobacteria bacterium]|jgi:thioredoxin-related protein|nr:thioredoxin fold domain-containing protein [Gammaproteobacteria bacterium]MBT3723839.1 thioredoxin fold domain-containing protein [Gammaproteobacteria bacterium]MBT4075046.1 thioredoxin fold domain-containing protein [Gammaproteobacteria bacterium]MBT4193753.1 thioredoxin fold domain-containing protein [Gammaproteobacteria bacterium]MBT4451896.1 thioredoxin fold domain-containing protein [Gammaproteobacteria bacterium]